jgi:hypothetical protein
VPLSTAIANSRLLTKPLDFRKFRKMGTKSNYCCARYSEMKQLFSEMKQLFLIAAL